MVGPSSQVRKGKGLLQLEFQGWRVILTCSSSNGPVASNIIVSSGAEFETDSMPLDLISNLGQGETSKSKHIVDPLLESVSGLYG